MNGIFSSAALGARASLALLLGLSALGCAATGATLRGDGLDHPEYGYQVRHRSGEQFISEDWRVDNFYQILPTNTQYGSSSSAWHPKVGSEYRSTNRFDANGDGLEDATEEVQTFDLLLEHKKTEGLIWLRSIPLSETDSLKLLSVFARRYAHGLSGPEVFFRKEADSVRISSLNYVARIVSEGPALLSEKEAYSMVVEVANVDQLELDKHARVKRLKVVFVRTGYEHRVHSAKFPVLMVIGLSDFPEHFEGEVADFDKFLGQIVLGGKSGYEELPKASALEYVPELSPGVTAPVVMPPAGPERTTPETPPASAPPVSPVP